MELNKYIEHTLLKQDATINELETLFQQAIEHKFLGICVNPCNVVLAHSKLQGTGVKIVTVVGFPLGASTTEAKAHEAKLAIEQGCDEVDMVLNVGRLKDKDYGSVQQDIEIVKNACGNKVLKVILETDLLTKDEIKNACELCINAKADFVKTSTGFVKNGTGAKEEDVKLMHETVAPYSIGVKASAGIKDKQKTIDLINAGASRIGTSSGVEIVS